MFERIFSLYRMIGLLFTLEMIVSGVAFCIKLPRRGKFALRLSVGLASYVLMSVLLVSVFLFGWETDWVFTVEKIIYFVLLLGIGTAVVYACFKIDYREAFITGMGIYATQHLAYCIFSIAYFLIFKGRPPSFAYIFFELAFTAAVAAGVWFLLLRKFERITAQKRDFRFVLLSLFTFASCIVLSAFVERLSSAEYAAVIYGICRPYAILCCILLLAVVFGLSCENTLRRDSEMVETLLHIEKEHHKIRSESKDIIDMKCHDLKHWLALMKTADDKKAYDELIAEVSEAIDDFGGTSVKTGNDALDIIIGEQLMRCKKFGIKFDCMADGKELSFMKTSDVLALFGNAIDNAVEAVKALPEERRFIFSLPSAK